MKEKGKKVMIVDDEVSILEALSSALSSEGYLVKSMARADGIIEKISKWKPDLVVLDFLLSGQDGVEVIKKIKKNSYAKNIPILMISAHPNAQVEIMESGADDFLPKPFDLASFLLKVKKLL